MHASNHACLKVGNRLVRMCFQLLIALKSRKNCWIHFWIWTTLKIFLYFFFKLIIQQWIIRAFDFNDWNYLGNSVSDFFMELMSKSLRLKIASRIQFIYKNVTSHEKKYSFGCSNQFGSTHLKWVFLTVESTYTTIRTRWLYRWKAILRAMKFLAASEIERVFVISTDWHSFIP